MLVICVPAAHFWHLCVSLSHYLYLNWYIFNTFNFWKENCLSVSQTENQYQSPWIENKCKIRTKATARLLCSSYRLLPAEGFEPGAWRLLPFLLFPSFFSLSLSPFLDSKQISGRSGVVKDTPAPTGDSPWSAQMGWQKWKGNRFLCGSVVVSALSMHD